MVCYKCQMADIFTKLLYDAWFIHDELITTKKCDTICTVLLDDFLSGTRLILHAYFASLCIFFRTARLYSALFLACFACFLPWKIFESVILTVPAL